MLISWLIFLSMIFSVQARNALSTKRLEQLSGRKVVTDPKTRWDQRYSRRNYIYGKAPAPFLAENYHYIPYGSKVLDMGMGEGRNSVFLAQKGYDVTGIDISSVAVKKAQNLAQEFEVSIKTVVASLKSYKLNPASFDAIINFYWVDRIMIDKIKTWLKPGGILIYEAYTTRQKTAENSGTPISMENALKPQELLGMFSDFSILKFEEPDKGEVFRSSIILKKKEE